VLIAAVPKALLVPAARRQPRLALPIPGGPAPAKAAMGEARSLWVISIVIRGVKVGSLVCRQGSAGQV
jgi:hypothetical protein